MKVSIAILCGGRSSRFNGDKTVTAFRGKPLYRVIWDRLGPKTEDIFLQVRDGDKYTLPSHKDLLGCGGPLEGIYSALVNSRAEWVFISACDLPLIDPRLIDELGERADHGSRVVIPRWRSGYYEPLAALYHSSLAAEIKESLGRDIHKITEFLDGTAGVREVSIEDLVGRDRISEKCFYNVNTRADLERLRI